MKYVMYKGDRCEVIQIAGHTAKIRTDKGDWMILLKDFDIIDKEKPEAPAEEGKSDWSLSHMNKTALKEYAEERGLELSMDMKKSDMIEAIKNV